MNKTYLVIALLCLFSSCATIVSSGSSIVGVDTEPQGAHVEIRNRKGIIVYNGRTPATISLKHASGFFQKATYQVKLSMDGFQPRTVMVDSHVNAWYFGNILFGGFVGFLVIDPMTGAMYKLNNTEIDEKLVPQGSGAVLQPAIPTPGRDASRMGMPVDTSDETITLRVITLKEVPADRQKDLVRL